MFPNNDEFMYRYAQMRSNEIRDEVKAARDSQDQADNRHKRLVLALRVGFIGVTLALALLALGWWVL